MENVQFFQRLSESSCTFCGHTIPKETDAYTNVCQECLDELAEK